MGAPNCGVGARPSLLAGARTLELGRELLDPARRVDETTLARVGGMRVALTSRSTTKYSTPLIVSLRLERMVDLVRNGGPTTRRQTRRG